MNTKVENNQRQYDERVISEIVNLLLSYRIDIKNYGGPNNGLVVPILGKATVLYPKWLKDKNGSGAIIENSGIECIKTSITAINSGKLAIKFRTKDLFLGAKRFDFLKINYLSIVVNGKQILSTPKETSFNNFYFYKLPVKHNEIVTIEIKINYHDFSYKELRKFVKCYITSQKAIHPFNDLDVSRITNIILEKIYSFKTEKKNIDNFPHITADCFIPIDDQININNILKEYNLYNHKSPFDFINDVSLQSVIYTLMHSTCNWFNDYSVEFSNDLLFVTDKLNLFKLVISDTSIDLAQYISALKSKIYHYHNLLLASLHKSERVCFISNRNENIYDYIAWLKKISVIFPNLKLMLINLTNNEEQSIKYKVENNIEIYQLTDRELSYVELFKKFGKNLLLSTKENIFINGYDNLIEQYEHASEDTKFIIAQQLYLHKKISILNDRATIDVIKNRKLSISRYGDGEIRWMLFPGFKGGFQSYDEKLAHRLQQVFVSQHPQMMICMDTNFDNGAKLSDYYKKVVMASKFDFCLFCHNNAKFGSTGITRKGKNIPIIKEIWQDKDIIIVEGQYSRLGVGNDLFDNVKSLRRILCPAENAFNKYQDILNECKKQTKNVLFIIALGPTATVLSYDLTVEGYWALDLGHIDIVYEWHLLGAKEKVLIPGKYVNEVKGGNIVTECKDPDYIKSIIATIL